MSFKKCAIPAVILARQRRRKRLAADCAKVLAVDESAEKAEREAARLGAVAAATAASNAADLEVEGDWLMAENVALEGRACADAAAVQELKTKVCNVSPRGQFFLGALSRFPPAVVRPR
jgi:hypothetical protein